MLLFYMLNINYMLQCTATEVDALISWIAGAVTETSATSTEKPLINQFILALDECRADRGSLAICSALGPMEKTIFWDKLRTNVKPHGPHFANKDWIAIRLEPCINVIYNVKKQLFTKRIVAGILKASSCFLGKTYFYDQCKAGWPAVKTVYDEERQATLQLPIEETDIRSNMCSQHRCLWIEKRFYDAVVDLAEAIPQPVAEYATLIVTSSEFDVDSYNFYEAVTTGTWFGYRSAALSSFGPYCGGSNFLYVGSPQAEMKVEQTTLVENEMLGFGTIEELYNFHNLKKFFGYFPTEIEKLPPGYKKLAFETRDADGDCVIDAGASKYECELPPLYEDDEQTSGNSCPPEAEEVLGSSPLRDISNKRNQERCGHERTPKKKKRRISELIDDEAEGDDGDNDEVLTPRA